MLLRGLDERGFCFFTNYRSAKARELEAHPQVALTFGWLQVHRSVRVEGLAERLPEAESDAYFAARPRAAQISAWASPQSEVISSREELERAVAAVEQRFADAEAPRPRTGAAFWCAPSASSCGRGARGACTIACAMSALATAGAWSASPQVLRGGRRCRGRRCRGRRGRGGAGR